MMQTSSQVDTSGNISPLVTTAYLHCAAKTFIELGKIIGLQDHVAELGVGDAFALAINSLLHRFLLNHGIDRKMFTDIPLLPADPGVSNHLIGEPAQGLPAASNGYHPTFLV